MLGEGVEHLSGYQVLVQLGNKRFRVLLDMAPEVHQITIDVVIDFRVAALRQCCLEIEVPNSKICGFKM